MQIFEYGNPESEIVLLEPVGEHDLESLRQETARIAELSKVDFRWIGFLIKDWNRELSPWEAPAVFGREDFGSGARNTLNEILKYCGDRNKTYYLGGYSLAGLFSLWAAHQTDTFSGIAAVSPSVWFPGFDDYMREHALKSDHIYLSLGDKEERTRNPVMRTVGDKIREACANLRAKEVNCILEWNPGNHFKEPDLRMARGFAWLLNEKLQYIHECKK